MADFYLDISAIGNEYQAYTDTPTTWGVPQDGNGKAGPGHAAAVAVATIDVAGCTAAGTGTIGVLGVTVSSTLTGTGSTLATAIVAAINASATAVSATYSALLLPLNKLVYARVNPSVNTQVNIMLRIAGTDWVGFTPTQVNISPAATISNFAGGANGPFAYCMNGATVFGKTIGNYGLWLAGSPAVTPINQTTDVVHGRTRRGGSDLLFQVDFTTSFTGTWKQCNYLFDNGTVWAGDNGTLTAKIRYVGGSSLVVVFNIPAAGKLSFASRERRKLDVVVANTASGSGGVKFAGVTGANTQFSFSNSGFVEDSSHVAGTTLSLFEVGSSVVNIRIDCSGSFVGTRGVVRQTFSNLTSSAQASTTLNGLIYEVVAATQPIGKPFIQNGSGATGRVEWCGGEIRDSNGVYKCVSPFDIHPSAPNLTVVCDNVLGVTDVSVGLAESETLSSSVFWNSAEGPNRGFRLEKNSYVVDWKGDGTFPHCEKESLQGDLWSHRVTWSAVPSGMHHITVLKLSEFYRDASAQKTLTIQLYVPDAYTFYRDDLDVTVSYIDSGDVWRVERLAASMGESLAASRQAVLSSAKTWTPNGAANFSPKKLELTTTYPIKIDSEVTAHLALCASRSPSLVFYVSPELEVS